VERERREDRAIARRIRRETMYERSKEMRKGKPIQRGVDKAPIKKKPPVNSAGIAVTARAEARHIICSVCVGNAKFHAIRWIPPKAEAMTTSMIMEMPAPFKERTPE